MDKNKAAQLLGRLSQKKQKQNPDYYKLQRERGLKSAEARKQKLIEALKIASEQGSITKN